MRDFRPLPLLGHPDAQTVAAALIRRPWVLPSVTEIVPLPDGDALAMEVSTPEGWGGEAPTVVAIPGLCGTHESPYVDRLARRLVARGVRSVRLNPRGWGTGRGLSRRSFHSGRSQDVRAALEHLSARWPSSPLGLVAFSLGGNIALKLAAELDGALPELRAIVAVCPAADLAGSSRKLSQRRNRIYEWRFVRQLIAEVRERHRRFPDLPASVPLSASMSLFEFDDAYIAPVNGFGDAPTYYRECAALPLVPRIEHPCRILFARDDPMVESRAFEGANLPDAVTVELTDRGGHLGFLGRSGMRWMDDWVHERLGVLTAWRRG